MSDLRWKTAITKVEPNKILLRGYRLDELIGRISYGDAIYLALKGELPPGNEGKVIEAILVSVIDHGGSPPSTLAARTIASTGAELSAAVAGGILAISQYHGGAIEECMNVLSEGVAYQHETSAALEDAAEWVVKRYRDRGKRIHGFGHRLHTRDPRTARLFELAATWGVAGRFVAMARAIERALSERLQRPMPINADGAIAALLCELHFEPALADAFFMMARIPGLVAHIHEERSRQKPMRRIHPTDIEYDGPEERPWTGERVE
ncbi:MAG: citryl-CoA lyase [Acidobacteria bacterium]|nr:MAG: citryl-CoA lyase [Acidobacteriota bacterium]